MQNSLRTKVFFHKKKDKNKQNERQPKKNPYILPNIVSKIFIFSLFALK